MAVLAQDLRDAVLKAAFEGKLSNGCLTDKPISKLLEDSAIIREKLENKNIIRKEKNYYKVITDDYPFEIPSHWMWITLSTVISLLSGQDLTASRYNSANKGMIYLTGASNLDNNNNLIINRWTEEPRAIAKKGDILLSCKGTVGKTHILNLDSVHIARQFMAIKPIGVNTKYVHLFIKYYVEELNRKAKSIIPGIERKDVLSAEFPLPPLEEQQRIVDRVEELMAKIDEYEAIENKLVALKKAFPQEMKDALLQAAMEGKISEQLDGEKICDTIESTFESDEEIDIPENWKMFNLKDIAKVNGGYAFKSSNFSNDGIRVIRISDFNTDGFVNANIVRHKYDVSLEPFVLDEKNILLCMTGGTVGKSLFVTDIDEKMVTNQRVATIKIENAIPEFVYYRVISPSVQNVINDSKNSTNDNISMGTINSFSIPLPPIEEQQRIVNKLDSLLPLCDKLAELN